MATAVAEVKAMAAMAWYIGGSSGGGGGSGGGGSDGNVSNISKGNFGDNTWFMKNIFKNTKINLHNGIEKTAKKWLVYYFQVDNL